MDTSQNRPRWVAVGPQDDAFVVTMLTVAVSILRDRIHSGTLSADEAQAARAELLGHYVQLQKLRAEAGRCVGCGGAIT